MLLFHLNGSYFFWGRGVHFGNNHKVPSKKEGGEKSGRETNLYSPCCHEMLPLCLLSEFALYFIQERFLSALLLHSKYLVSSYL